MKSLYLNGPKTLRLLLVCVMVMPVFAMQQPPNIRMQLTGESGAGLYEPLYATFSVQNNTGEVIQFDLGINSKEAFELSITSPDATVHETGRLPDDGIGGRGLVSISPGQTYSQRLLLNEWYDFSTPGTYGSGSPQMWFSRRPKGVRSRPQHRTPLLSP